MNATKQQNKKSYQTIRIAKEEGLEAPIFQPLEIPVCQPETQEKKVLEFVDFRKNTSFLKKIKLRRNDTNAFLINMELSNGFIVNFIIFVDLADNSFEFRKKKYVVDDSMKVWNASTGLFCLNYHEDLSIPVENKIIPVEQDKKADSAGKKLSPIGKKVDVNAVKKAIKAVEPEIETLLNPSVLKHWKKSRLHEMILRGASIDSFLRQMRLLMWILLFMAFLHLLLFVVKSGMLKSIKMPF